MTDSPAPKREHPTLMQTLCQLRIFTSRPATPREKDRRGFREPCCRPVEPRER